MSERLAWIRYRRESGQDFSHLVEAVSRLVVEWSHEGQCLAVDASALASSPSAVQGWALYPEAASLERGHWCHPQSGISGPLAEVLFSIAMTYIERPAITKATGTATEVGEP